MLIVANLGNWGGNLGKTVSRSVSIWDKDELNGSSHAHPALNNLITRSLFGMMIHAGSLSHSQCDWGPVLSEGPEYMQRQGGTTTYASRVFIRDMAALDRHSWR